MGAIGVTLPPSSSITNSCSVGLVKPFGGTKPLRLLTNATLPPATGHGPRLSTPYPRRSYAGPGSNGFVAWNAPMPVLGVNSPCVSRSTRLSATRTR